MRNMLEPELVEPGYHLFKLQGVAIMSRGVWQAMVSRFGPIDDADAWLALSDSIAFRHDFLPPDLVLVSGGQEPFRVLCERTVEVD